MKMYTHMNSYSNTLIKRVCLNYVKEFRTTHTFVSVV